MAGMSPDQNAADPVYTSWTNACFISPLTDRRWLTHNGPDRAPFPQYSRVRARGESLESFVTPKKKCPYAYGVYGRC
jgi:hypothetical protein